MRVAAIIQARLGSTRLPKKVLMDVGGRSMLARVVDRVQTIRGLHDVAVAIPDLSEDDLLETAVLELGVRCVRGSAADVLRRYRIAAEELHADAIVRVTADCPALSPSVASRVVTEFLDGEADYCSNTLDRTWPRGMDTEVVRATALRQADALAEEPSEREHVTPYIWRRPEQFRLRSVRNDEDLSSYRLTVDTEEDLALIRALYAELGDSFDVGGAIELLQLRPDLRGLNIGIEQKPV
jgi:spore coat polysaccharide biosynthesis protein SpsF